jgi:starvation-inducible DNA-binding protein
MKLNDALTQVFNTNFVAYLHAHISHVNVVGRNFTSDHKLLGKIYEDLQGEIDKLAELLRTIDEFMPQDAISIIRGSTIMDYPVVGSADDLLQGVYGDLQDLKACYEDLIEAADSERHIEISNYAQDRILVIGKYSWMLKSTLGEYAETPEDFDIFSDED